MRPGIAVYGLSPVPQLGGHDDYGLVPAMTLEAELANVKTVPGGHGVSYAHQYVTAHDTVLGLVPVGYADGIPRHASGTQEQPGGPVRVGGRTVGVAGRVCMDQVVVDLGPGATEQAGDRVELFGTGRDGGPTAQDWAVAAGTISYEIVTRIGARVPRVHVDSEAAGAPMSVTVRLPDADATRAYGRALAGVLRAGDLVVLTGDLGAGKTTLTQGIGAGLHVRGQVASPTFIIAREHPPVPRADGTRGPTLVHVDAYRLGSLDEVDALDLDASLDEAVTVVEWGEGWVESLAQDRLEVTLQRPRGGALADDDLDDAAAGERVVTVRAVGARWADVDLPDADPVAG